MDSTTKQQPTVRFTICNKTVEIDSVVTLPNSGLHCYELIGVIHYSTLQRRPNGTILRFLNAAGDGVAFISNATGVEIIIKTSAPHECGIKYADGTVSNQVDARWIEPGEKD